MSFAIIFSTTSAFAASPVGWSASPADIIMNGAQATITALKGQGASALQSTIKHAPTAANVGKKIIRGGGAAALLIAVPQILGAGVDWVLDPANNRIVYTEVADVNDAVTPASPLAWCKWYDECSAGVYNYGSADAAGRATCKGYNETFVKIIEKPPYTASSFVTVHCKRKDGSNDMWNTRAQGNPTYDPSITNPEPEKKYLPISTVAAKVLANAAAGDAASQELVKTVAIEDLESGALDVPLNIAAVPKADAPAVPDAPVVPADPDAPVVPFDPSSIIAAIKSVMAAIVNMAGMIGAKFDALIENDNVNAKAEADVAAQEKIDRDAKAKADAEFADWAQTPPKEDTEDTTVAIPDTSVLPADTDVNFGGSCPANFEVNSSIFGNPINIVLLDTAKFCGFLSTFVKYPVYAVSSLFALYILGGRKDV